jgi:hypothetical protein
MISIGTINLNNPKIHPISRLSQGRSTAAAEHTEMIMSTRALALAGDSAPAENIEAKAGFWSRLIAVRQAQANRMVRAHLLAMGAARLAELGFTENDIRALRAGDLKLPSGKKGE